MNRTNFLFTVGLIGHTALLAQTQPTGTYQLAYQELLSAQQAQSLSAGGRGGRGIVAQPALRSEPGKPFSATVITQTTQTFLDGTHVSQTTTVLEYRDAEGRVRTETSPPSGAPAGQAKVITIRDPLIGTTYVLDPAKKSARKMGGPTMTGAMQAAGARGRGGGAAPPEQVNAALQALQDKLATARAAQPAQAPGNPPNDIVEDLGTLTVNGVPARGTRITTVVPVGAIGNDKEFRSVSERWFSPDLNLLIKSVNTDPRFGTTTYERTNISRQAPDASLFQVPVDYSVTSNDVRQQ